MNYDDTAVISQKSAGSSILQNCATVRSTFARRRDKSAASSVVLLITGNESAGVKALPTVQHNRFLVGYVTAS